MIYYLLLSLLLPLCLGYLFISLLWPEARGSLVHHLLKASLAVGLGFGLSSAIFFLWISLNHASINGVIILEVGLVLALFALLLFKNKPGSFSPSRPAHYAPRPPRTLQRILWGSFLVALSGAFLAFTLRALKIPHGKWDAWAIWNMHARFLFRGGERWTDLFNPLLAHADYPLLIPGLVARSWKYVGTDTVVVPMLVALLFTFASLGVLVSCLGLLRGASQGLLAGLAILGTPSFIKLGTTQYADLPVAFFFLATVAFYCLDEGLSADSRGLIPLAGMMAGFSAWTKNEGFLFIGAVIITRCLIVVRKRGWKPYLNEMRWFALGLVPILLMVGSFKIKFAPANELLAAQGIEATFSKLLDGSRYLQAGQAFFHNFAFWGDWPINLPLLLVIYYLLIGINGKTQDKSFITTPILTFCLMLLGYFLVFIISPLNLSWHLSTSLDRLFLQLWPMGILGYFLLVPTPEEVGHLPKPTGSSARTAR